MSNPVRSTSDFIRIAYNQLSVCKNRYDSLAYEKYSTVSPDVNKNMTMPEILNIVHHRKKLN